MLEITQSIEAPRGCGYRKPGGLYMVSGGLSASCFKLPVALSVCPCCNQGIKPSRGFTWISSRLFNEAPCQPPPAQTSHCGACPMNQVDTAMGLLWIGEKFYATPDLFSLEAARMGVSRRIAQIPLDFKIGETWIALAHRKCALVDYDTGEETIGPGIFHAFKPNRIEYVVAQSDSEEKLKRLVDRGVTLVRVIRDIDTQLELALEPEKESPDLAGPGLLVKPFNEK